MFKPETLIESNTATVLTQQLNQRIGEFDVLSLLRYLKHRGYQEQNIRFNSHQSLVSQTHLIEKVALYERHALITLNLGLLGVQTPMPSEMLLDMVREHVDTGDDIDRLLKLLDHSIILNFLASIYPEFNIDFFSDWSRVQRNLLLIQNVHSNAFLFWLFQRVFPEFVIQFGEKFVPRTMPTTAITLNQFSLGGGATIGGVTVKSDLCVHINLFLELDHYRIQSSWVTEVEMRLDKLVYPLLSHREIYLFISLELEHESPVRLVADGRMGRDLLPGDTAENAAPTLQFFVLHQGGVFVPEEEPPYEVQWGGACRIRV